MYVLLGLKGEAAEKAREDVAKSRADASGFVLRNMHDTEGAAIPVDDYVPSEHRLHYDKNNPIMMVEVPLHERI